MLCHFEALRSFAEKSLIKHKRTLALYGRHECKTLAPIWGLDLFNTYL
jgi:hypothetical protein